MTKAKQKLPNDLIGVAGVHFVAFRLSFRGLIVLPTIRNTAGIDLLVNDPVTGGHASLQVKTSMKRVKIWSTSSSDKCLRRPHSFYVFLRCDRGEDTFEAFLESAECVAQQIEHNEAEDRVRGRKKFAYWQLPRRTLPLPLPLHLPLHLPLPLPDVKGQVCCVLFL